MATINAASLSHADVTAALALASPGDIVQLGAGSATWATEMTVPAGVALKGAGGGWIQGSSTSSVAVSTGSKSFTIKSNAKHPSGSTAIFGFTAGEQIVVRQKQVAANTMTGTVTAWDGTTLVVNVASVTGSGTAASWNFQKLGATRIAMPGGVAFTKHATYVGGMSDVEVTQSTGDSVDRTISIGGAWDARPVVIGRVQMPQHAANLDTNGALFYQCSIHGGFNWAADSANRYGFLMVTHGGDPNTWARNSTMGALDTTGERNIYLEDCYATGMLQELFDTSAYARSVIRYCVLDHSGGTSHGWDTSFVGGNRHAEFYNNYCIFEDNGNNANTALMSYFLYMRGGPWVLTDNHFEEIQSGWTGAKNEVIMTVQNLRRNAGTYACRTAYPAPHQLGQGYKNGVGGVDGSNYVEGVYIWNNSGTYNVSLDDFTPNECGGGAPAVSTFVQEGRDYFLTAKTDDGFGSPYAKYTYPHPLRGGSVLPAPGWVRAGMA